MRVPGTGVCDWVLWCSEGSGQFAMGHGSVGAEQSVEGPWFGGFAQSVTDPWSGGPVMVCGGSSYAGVWMSQALN